MRGASDTLGEILLRQAALRLGTPYRLDPPPDGVNTLDCSLYVILTFRDAGTPFGPGVRTAEQIRQACDEIVPWDAVLPGDLLFFENTYDAPGPAGPDGRIASHVGISCGAGTQLMWDCRESSSATRPDGVGQTDISTAYWQDRIFEARRARLSDPTAAHEGRYRLSAAGVRLRGAPGTSQPIVVEDLGQDAVVHGRPGALVQADGHLWRSVRTAEGAEGWVATDFLRLHPLIIPTDAADHAFTHQELRPHIEAAALLHGADARIVAALIAQESSFRNWRVHADGTGHGLIGLDDNGLLPEFERWSGLSCGRGADAISIPPLLQIEFCARTLGSYAARYGSALNAARVWHRGPSLWTDERGDFYEARIQERLDELSV